MKLINATSQIEENEKTVTALIAHIEKHKIRVGLKDKYQIILKDPEKAWPERCSDWLLRPDGCNGDPGDWEINWYIPGGVLVGLCFDHGNENSVLGTIEGDVMSLPNAARNTMWRLIREVKKKAKERPAGFEGWF